MPPIGRSVSAGAWMTAVFLAIVLAPFQSGAQLVFEKIVTTGDAAPGTPGVFGASLFPRINGNGDVLVNGHLLPTGGVGSGDDEGIWVTDDVAGLLLVVREGDPLPGANFPAGGLSFNSTFFDDDRNVIFPGFEQRYFWSPGAGTQVLPEVGEAAPGTTGVFAMLESFARLDHSMNASGLSVIRALLEVGVGGVTTDDRSGLWLADHDVATELMARWDHTIAGTPWIMDDLVGRPVMWPNGMATAVLGVSDGVGSSEWSTWLWRPSSGAELLGRVTDPAPDTTGVFWTAPYVVISPTGEIAYSAQLEPGVGGVTQSDRWRIWSDVDGGGVVEVVRQGDIVPGGSAPFRDFSMIGIASEGRVFFFAGLANQGGINDDCVIIRHRGGMLERVMCEGDAVPGQPGASFGDPTGTRVTPNGELVFRSDLDVGGVTEPSAIYSWDESAGLQKVLQEGDLFEILPGDFRSVEDIYRAEQNSSRQLAVSLKVPISAHTVQRVQLPRAPVAGTVPVSGGWWVAPFLLLLGYRHIRRMRM